MIAALALGIGLAIGYAPTAAWMWESWHFRDAYWAHAPLVVAFAVGWIVWQRERLARLPARVDRRGLALLVPGLGVHLVAAVLQIDSLSALSLLLSIPGAVWLTCGPQRLRALLPVLGLLPFVIPTPLVVTSTVAFQLKEFATGAGLGLAQALGLDAARVGAEIRIPGQAEALVVAAPCSGLRSLVALTTLGYGLAFFTGAQRGARRWLLLLAAAPVAVLTNVVRIAGLCWLAAWQGVPFATGAGHDLLNGAVWIVDLAILLGIDQVLSTRARRAGRGGVDVVAAARGADPDGAPASVAGGRLGITAAAVIAVGGLTLWLDATRPAGGPVDRSARLAASAGGFRQLDAYPLGDDELRMLGTRDAVCRRYGDADGSVYLYAVFHDADWKSVHPPRTCLEGSNMEIVSDDVRRLGDDGPAVGRLVCWSLDRERRYLSLFAYVAPPDRVRAGYGEFVLDALPRALLRRSNAGALVRVETWVDDDDLGRAQARCGRFFRAILPEILACLR